MRGSLTKTSDSGERQAPPGIIISETVASEDNLQRQLHVERFARPNARRSVVVANRVTGLSEAAAQPTARRRKVDSVEEVVHLDSELRIDAFRDLRVFNDGKVHGRKTGSVV